MYRANRHPQDQPTDLERYGEAHIAGLFCQYPPMKDPKIVGKLNPNYDFWPMIEDAAQMSEKIDFFESHPGLLDQVVFGIACPELCHRGVKDVVDNRRLVALLLMRHFKKFGGLCLPPLEAGREAHAKNVKHVKADMAARREPTLVHYPNWYVWNV
ncbi:hypothetical protein BDU57DRAFT_497495 [Ampelomyces quisqualis]|uniref:Uncharacterized protein n=1 Tax=Ampelomyces quisqualis TaxID=50730 RepID=A0A6A5QMI0_AMPQU|nr:hypothetical protein BDU57DRAFT_497495 [Ampelomyces quisqualis]